MSIQITKYSLLITFFVNLTFAFVSKNHFSKENNLMFQIPHKKLDCILFDCDGTICETELVTLASFNEAFKAKSLNVYWDIHTYSELLKVGASKERIIHFFDFYNQGKWPIIETQTPSAKIEKLEYAKILQDEKNKCFQEVVNLLYT